MAGSGFFSNNLPLLSELPSHSNTSWTSFISNSKDNSEVHKGDRHIVSCVATTPCSQPSSVSIISQTSSVSMLSQPVIALSFLPQSPQVVELPSFRPLSDLHLQWNDLSGDECIELVKRCYSKAVHWVSNFFKIRYGKLGRFFVKELTHHCLYSEDSAL